MYRYLLISLIPFCVSIGHTQDYKTANYGGYIDIEKVKRDNPVPDINLSQKGKETKSAVDRVKMGSVNIPDVTIKQMNVDTKLPDKQKVPDYLNHTELTKQINTVDLEKIAKQYNDALNSKQPKKGNSEVSDFSTGRAYLFISASIPKETLKALLNDAGKYNVSVFLKGNIGPDPLKFAGTQAFIHSLGEIDTPPELFIHPDAFKMFKIDKVPALVVASDHVSDNLDEQGCAAPNDFDIIRGDLNIASNLRTIFERTGSPDVKDVARQYVNKINGKI